MVDLQAVVRFLDTELRTAEIADYPGAVNGLQLANPGRIGHVHAAVDYSTATVDAATATPDSLLLVHHGMFWSDRTPIVGPAYQRLSALLSNRVALYASHLPLDVHPVHGNNVLLAGALGLIPSGGFATNRGVAVGVRGTSDLPTAELADHARRFCQPHGHHLVTTPVDPARRTLRWGICTGAGASTETIREALDLGIDTLIVGEGPHHTAVQAGDAGLTILYAGHYATETLGVQSVASAVAARFGISWSFIAAPTGL